MTNICPKTFVRSRDTTPYLYLHVDEYPKLDKITINSDNEIKFKFLECVCAKKCKTYSGRNKKIYADIYCQELFSMKLNNTNIKIEHYFIIFFGRNMRTEDIIYHLDNSIEKMSILNKKFRLMIVVSAFSVGIERVNIQVEYHKALEKHFGSIIDVKICPFKPELRKYLEISDTNPLFLM